MIGKAAGCFTVLHGKTSVYRHVTSTTKVQGKMRRKGGTLEICLRLGCGYIEMFLLLSLLLASFDAAWWLVFRRYDHLSFDAREIFLLCLVKLTLGSRGYSLSESWGRKYGRLGARRIFGPSSPRASNLWNPGYVKLDGSHFSKLNVQYLLASKPLMTGIADSTHV